MVAALPKRHVVSLPAGVIAQIEQRAELLAARAKPQFARELRLTAAYLRGMRIGTPRGRRVALIRDFWFFRRLCATVCTGEQGLMIGLQLDASSLFDR